MLYMLDNRNATITGLKVGMGLWSNLLKVFLMSIRSFFIYMWGVERKISRPWKTKSIGLT